MEKLLVTQALNELKLLDSRINNEIHKCNYVVTAKTVDKNVTPYCTKEDFVKKAKSNYDSVLALINRRSKIKSAVIISNATTLVEINGMKMTVAEAIDLKTTISYKKDMVYEMKAQLACAKNGMQTKNMELEKKIDNILETMVSKDAKTKKDDFKEITEPMRANGEYSLVDPLHIEDVIEKLENEINGFEYNVDSALQISNCITTIEI